MGTGDAGTVHCDSIGPSVARMSSDENSIHNLLRVLSRGREQRSVMPALSLVTICPILFLCRITPRGRPIRS
jgi:hypothetical protein